MKNKLVLCGLQVRNTKGQIIDGDGYIPDEYSKNKPELIAASTDVVIEDALAFLLAEYGIE